MEKLRVLTQACIQAGALLGGILGMILLLMYQGALKLPANSERWLLFWPVTAGAIYYVVHVDMRFLGAFVALFSLTAYAILLRSAPEPVRMVTRNIVLWSLLIPSTLSLFTEPILHPVQADDWIVAQQLGSLGVARGDRVAIVGTGYRAYWARCAGVQIVAQVVDWSALRKLSSAEFADLTARLANLNVRALVIPETLESIPGGPFHEIRSSDAYRFFVLLLKPGV